MRNLAISRNLRSGRFWSSDLNIRMVSDSLPNMSELSTALPEVAHSWYILLLRLGETWTKRVAMVRTSQNDSFFCQILASQTMSDRILYLLLWESGRAARHADIIPLLCSLSDYSLHVIVRVWASSPAWRYHSISDSLIIIHTSTVRWLKLPLPQLGTRRSVVCLYVSMHSRMLCLRRHMTDPIHRCQAMSMIQA